nr:hypothetical protein [Tanacetum cinerariifolium]
MINSIKNGDQPLPRVTQVSIAGTSSNEQPPLKDKSMWSDQEKNNQKINRLARSLLIQGLSNDIYSLIDSNMTAKDLWDALARYMLGFEYGEQDRKAAVLYEYETFKDTEEELLLDTYIRYLQVINDLKKCGYSKDNYVNDAMGSKKKTVVVTSDPLALIAEKTNVSRSKEKVVVSSDSEVSEADDFGELKKITALLAKAFNRRKFYSKPTNNNLRTSSTSQSANKKQEFVKIDNCMDEKKQDMSRVLKDQLQVKHVVIDTHVECQEKYAKLEVERYEYMIRYSAYFDNDKKHKKQIDDQKVLYDKMSVQLIGLDKHVRDLKNTVLEKDFKISELEECVRNKDLEIEKCLERLTDCENKLHKMGQTNQTVHMIMPSKDNLYNGKKGIGFENLSYFEKAKDLRPTLYNEKVIGLGYTPMFLTHSNEALEIEKFKRSRENKIEFAYDFENLNASYVNENINFEDDYFQEIINPDFKKIDSPFQQTSSLKPYVLNVILEKIIIDLEDKVVNLLEKEKANVEIIESLKSKECDKEENPKMIAPGMFKLSVSQCVSLISMSKSSCESNNVEIKLKRKR